MNPLKNPKRVPFVFLGFFLGLGYDTIRLITRDVCKKHGVHHQDVSASTAFGALWKRLSVAEVSTLYTVLGDANAL